MRALPYLSVQSRSAGVGRHAPAAPNGIQLAEEGSEMRDDSQFDVELEPRNAASPDACRFGSGGSGGGSGT